MKWWIPALGLVLVGCPQIGEDKGSAKPPIAQSAARVGIEDVPNPRRQNRWVTDFANMLEPATESKINSLLDSAHRELKIEVAVVTVNSVTTPTPKDFATGLFNHWGIGDAKRNDGLLILMVKDARRLEMETGYGLEEALPDGWLKSMQEAEMVPLFKREAYGEGLLRGAELSIERIRGHSMGIPTEGDYKKPFPWYILLISAGVLGVSGGGMAWKHKRDRTCDVCKKRMQMLPEDEDDQHLTKGQVREEELGSVDWQYWYCAPCNFSRLLRVSKFRSGYSKCKSCKYKTMASSYEVLSAATTYSSGQAQITLTCMHCDFSETSYRTLPRIVESSSDSGGGSSGGGGGGSFGGGSSGGGGAGSSW